MSKYKIGDKFIVISSDMNAVKVGDILEYRHDLINTNLFSASGWIINNNNNDLSIHGYLKTKLQLLKENTMNEVTIEVPEGYVIDEENSSFTCIKFKKEGKKEVKCWEDLKRISGYYVSDRNAVLPSYNEEATISNRNIFATEEQAEASIALAMLSQLLKDVNGDWIPDYSDESRKFIIRFYKNKINSDWFYNIHYFLAFQTEEIRDTFLKNHEELIMKAKSLL